MDSFIICPFIWNYDICSALICVLKVRIVDNEAQSAEGHDKNWKSGEKVKKVNVRTLELSNQYCDVDSFDLLQQ